MSMSLSGANSIAGSMRGHATAQARRQASTVVAEVTKANLKLWSDAFKATPAKPRRKRKR